MGVGVDDDSPDPLAPQQQQQQQQTARQAAARQQHAARQAAAQAQQQAQQAAQQARHAASFNNFLSVIVQCLWHCADFRGQVRATPRLCGGSRMHNEMHKEALSALQWRPCPQKWPALANSAP